MFQLSEFYGYATENDIDIISYTGMPHPAATMRDMGYYAVVVDFSQIDGIRQLNTIYAHEMGHCATGALHKVSSPYEMVARSEYKANRWWYEQYLTPSAFQAAFDLGYTTTWQLADFFDFPEDDIKKALHYWTQCRGVNFNASTG